MDEYVASNRRVWDAWTKIHLDSAFYDVDSFRNGERAIRIKDFELEEIGEVTGKTLLHLQCHFGLDTLSWARLGAIVTGAAFSAEAIAAAEGLAEALSIPARFVRSHLDDLPPNLAARRGVDRGYSCHGVLRRLPD